MICPRSDCRAPLEEITPGWTRCRAGHVVAREAPAALNGGGPGAGPHGAGGKKRGSRASALVSLSLENVAELWHTPDGHAYATVNDGGARQHWPLRSRTFAQWLARRFYEATMDGEHGEAVSREDLAAAAMTLEGVAMFGGAEYCAFTRVAGCEGRVYLDLGDARWRAVEIDARGWRIVGEPPVRFARAAGMLPLPEPVPGGSLDALRALINITDDRDWRLLAGWLVGALRPRGPYPVLALIGEQGSAKSMAARLLRGLVDPNTVALRAEPREVRDLMIAATHGWVITLDNLSRIQPWLSDALCRLSTGGGFSTRELYTDRDEALFDATRPVILTAITEVVERGDLLDRTLLVRLAPIPEERRRREADILRVFERARPAILGALCDAVSAGLRGEAETAQRLTRLPRLADWAVWVAAATQPLGWGDAVLAALAERREETNAMALEATPAGPLLLRLGERAGGWQGTAEELRWACAELAAEEIVPATAERRAEETRRQAERLLSHGPGWPRSGRGMRAILDRLAPHLRAAGVMVSHERAGHDRRRVIILRPVQEAGGRSSASSAPSAPGKNAEMTRDFAAGAADGAADGCEEDRPQGARSSAQPSAEKPLNDQGFWPDADGADDADDLAPTSSPGCIDCDGPLEPGQAYRCRACMTAAYQRLAWER